MLSICTLSRTQSVLNQPIDFAVQDKVISKALLQLSEQVNISISFKSNFFDQSIRISLDLKQVPLKQVLEQILQGTLIGFKSTRNSIILHRKPKPKYTLSGYLEDAESGERMIAATIYEAKSGLGTTTNEYGFYSLTLEQGPKTIQYSYLGFQPKEQFINLQKNKALNVSLTPALMLAEVLVTDQSKDIPANLLLPQNGYSFRASQSEEVPNLGGEADLMRYFQLFPGVQSGTDGIGGLQIRGGNADQNLILMDGVPVYNPSHTLGLFSIFNNSIVKSARLIKDGFSARYGGRLSSVMDVRTKEGNTQDYTGELSIGTFATKLTLEGPIIKDKSGFLVSFRRTHIDPLLSALVDSGDERQENKLKYHFFDLNTKVHFPLSPKDKIYFSFYRGGDKFAEETSLQEQTQDSLIFEEQELFLDWGNTIASLRWNHQYNHKLFSNTTATFSQFQYQSASYFGEFAFEEEDFEESYAASQFFSKITDVGLRLDFDYIPSVQHQLKFGAHLLVRNFEPGLVFFNESTFEEDFEFFELDSLANTFREDDSIDANEFNLYLEDQIHLGDYVLVKLGLHAALFDVEDKLYTSLQPRFFLQWQNQGVRLWGTYTRMTQFLHVLTTSSAGLPNDLWVPSTANVRPQEAWQTTIGFSQSLNNGLAFTVEGYYKKMNHLITYKQVSTLPSLAEIDASFWEEEVTSGKGWSTGLEVSVFQSFPKTNFWINYTLSRSERQFNLLNDGTKFPFRFERRHDLKLGFKHQFSDKISLNGNWLWGSGQPITLISTNFELPPFDFSPTEETERLSSHNGFRMPSYHRLDFSFNFQWQKKWAKHHLSIGLYNAYNRKNPFFIYFFNDKEAPSNSGIEKSSLLPMLPSFSYSLKF